MTPFEHSSERAEAVERLSRDFAFADVLCRLHYADGTMPPEFCGNELTRIWKEICERKLNWFERQVIYGRIEVIT